MPALRPWSARTRRPDQTQRLRRYWDKHARSYDRQMAFFERVLFGDGRQWVCAQAVGDTLEVAIGTGRNLAFYPDGIRLTGIDFSPQMLQLAQRQAEQLGRQVDLRLGDAQALDLPDGSFDTVVCTLSLCGIPDDRRAIAEMRRVLRPGGWLLLLDHVAAAPRPARAIQWLLERVTIPLGGEHLRRRPLLQVQAEGFDVERCERYKLGIVEQLAARKPSDPDVRAIRAALPANRASTATERRADGWTSSAFGRTLPQSNGGCPCGTRSVPNSSSRCHP